MTPSDPAMLPTWEVAPTDSSDLHYHVRRTDRLPIWFTKAQATAMQVALEQLEQLPGRRPRHVLCRWVPNAVVANAYLTTCGEEWQFTEGDLASNGVHYCPFCGGAVPPEPVRQP